MGEVRGPSGRGGRHKENSGRVAQKTKRRKGTRKEMVVLVYEIAGKRRRAPTQGEKNLGPFFRGRGKS